MNPVVHRCAPSPSDRGSLARRGWLQALLLPLLLLVACNRVPPTLPSPPARSAPWSQDVVAAMAAVPVQHEGRIKPLATLAAYALYEVHGRRDLKFRYLPPGAAEDAFEKVTLTPVEWLLDVLCYPDQAADYPLFRIENVAVLAELGIDHSGGQRFDFEFLSYRALLQRHEALSTARGRVVQKKRDNEQRKANGRPLLEITPVDEHILNLARHLNDYHGLHQLCAVVQAPFRVDGAALQSVFGGTTVLGLGELLDRARPFVEFLGRHQQEPEGEAAGNAFAIAQVLTEEVHADSDPALFPPLVSRAETERWLTFGQLIDQGLRQGLSPRHRELLGALQSALAQRPAVATHADREQALLRFAGLATALAEGRGERAGPALEARYHAWSLHYQALHWYLFGFVLAAGCWAVRSRWLWGGAVLVNVFATGLLVSDLVLRMWIVGRPMISNLYDTFLFIPAIAAIAGLVAEVITRRRMALAAVPAVAAVLIMLARVFEVSDGKDTLREIPAVLRSNFWLATHVTTINIGYAAGLFAAAVASAWLVLRTFRVKLDDHDFYKSMVRIAYGVTCFGLAFAVVGTILGGIWAEDSWGRFWGWDPKENGALMICLSQVALLHARMSGLVRDFGFCLWTGFTGIVVAFSWFHVNLLEVGLHSYGFSGGIARGLWTYYGVQTILLLIGVVGRFLPLPAPAGAAAQPPDLPAELTPSRQ